MKSVLLVAAGGAIGAVLRYLVGQGLKPESVDQFPWNTFLVNVIGCFAIGLFFTMLADSKNPNFISLFIMTGVLGGFTTFSSFALESFQMIKAQRFQMAAVYILFSNLAGGLALCLAYYFTYPKHS